MKNGKKATVNRSISCLFIRLVATMLACITSNFLYSQAPTIGEVRQLPVWTKIAQASGDNYAHTPMSLVFDIQSGGQIVKKIVINYQTNPDVLQFPMYHDWFASSDGGATWSTPTSTPNFDMVASARRIDGVLIAIPFYLGYTWPTLDTSFIFSYHTSSDNGTTWTEQTNAGLVNGFNGQRLTGLRFWRGIIQDADGTLYASAHAQFYDAQLQSYRTILLKSTNGGATWKYVSTIGYIDEYRKSLNEATLARCRDGSILAVIRRNGDGTPPPAATLTQHMVTTRSTDNGLTWAPIDSLQIPYAQGIAPSLHMLHNGVLVLNYGHNVLGDTMRHTRLAFSADGNGNTWSNITETFTSVTGGGLGTKSSGNNTVLVMGINRFDHVIDKGLSTYYGADPHPTPNPFSMWKKPIDIVLNYRDRIDLKSKYNTGDIAISTDLTYSNVTHPEARIAGAIDGNTDYWNGAFKVGSSGYYTIDLKSNHTINAIGVCLINGAPESATIEYSTDSVSWSTLKTYTNATHYTMDYTSLGSPVTLRYVRVNVTGTSLVGLNEIRLFSTADTYEDYALNYVPYGYTITPQSNGFKVSAGIPALPTGYKSERALYMEDIDPADVKEISKYGVTNGSKTLELKVRVKAFASGGAIQFRFRSGSTNVYRISIFPDGSIRYYSGGSYTIIGTAGTIPFDTWKHLKIAANAVTNVVNVYVDGTLIGSGTKETPSATSMDGFTFSSGGIAANGDKALFDDVEFYGGSTPGSRPGKEAAPEPVEEEIISKLKLTVSPNPAHQNVNLVIEHPSEGRADIQFINAQGQAAKILSYNGSKGRITKNIHVGDLAAGIYFIVVKQGKEIVKTKVVIN